MPTSADIEKWLLPWSSARYGWPTPGEGRPWGDGTKLAEREAAGGVPYDTDCLVTPLIGGYEAMSRIRDSLEDAIAEAWRLAKDDHVYPGQRGHVYIAGWRINALRDLSTTNRWRTASWRASDLTSSAPEGTATTDQTALGSVLRLMQAGVKVRILPWLPTREAEWAAASFQSHVDDHRYLASVVAAESQRLGTLWSTFGVSGLGIVALDLRVAPVKLYAASHHQKMIVIRVGDVNVAYVGGVDLAFTRRDAPSDPTSVPVEARFLDGDWQSGSTIPDAKASPTQPWPPQADVTYESLQKTDPPSLPPTDLPDDVYGTTDHVWHDQHLRLEGPIVTTLEEQFGERWIDTGRTWTLGLFSGSNMSNGQVIFSDGAAFAEPGDHPPSGILPLDDAAAVGNAGASVVQMWRTVPLREGARSLPPFVRGEFTAMAGTAKAASTASQLIWIFDQYFWSRPFAKQLNTVLTASDRDVHVIIILPPYADTQQLAAHHTRKIALNDLTEGLANGDGTFEKVAVYDLWDPVRKKGIYCHAKVQMYDQDLLVCGSVNLNRRSFTCDTEIACAVLDSAVVGEHQKRLWSLLFPSTAWPGIDTTRTDWGSQFFQAFKAAALSEGAYVVPDPWWNVQAVVSGFPFVITTPPTIPRSSPAIKREQDYREDFIQQIEVELGKSNVQAGEISLYGQAESENMVLDVQEVLEPWGLRRDIETGPDNSVRSLDEIVRVIEKRITSPYRTGDRK